MNYARAVKYTIKIKLKKASNFMVFKDLRLEPEAFSQFLWRFYSPGCGPQVFLTLPVKTGNKFCQCCVNE